MTYQKKAILVEAFQLGIDDPPDWFLCAVARCEVSVDADDFSASIKGREYWMYARRGDFVIKGVDGEIYPCRAEIFHATYDPVLIGCGVDGN